MFTAIVITPEKPLAEGLERLAVECGQVTVYKSLPRYPMPYELTRLLNSCDPDLVFLDIGDWEQAAAIAAKVRDDFPRTATIGFGGGWVPGRESYYAKCGIVARLVSPITVGEMEQGIAHALRQVRRNVYRNLAALLPAKAGSGCSLIVLNLAAQLRSLGKSVLVIDGDLASGVLGFRCGVTAALHLQDALSNPEALSRGEWDRFVVEHNGIDLLGAGEGRKGPRPQWSNYYHLLEFVTADYDFVLVDLPELINDATAEVVMRAGAVYLVSTTEAPALELARRRIADLTSRGVDTLRISVILNRCRSDEAPSAAQVESSLGHKVAMSLLADSDGIREVETNGHAADTTTEFGHSLRVLAARIAGVQLAEAAAVGMQRPKSRLASLLGR